MTGSTKKAHDNGGTHTADFVGRTFRGKFFPRNSFPKFKIFSCQNLSAVIS